MPRLTMTMTGRGRGQEGGRWEEQGWMSVDKMCCREREREEWAEQADAHNKFDSIAPRALTIGCVFQSGLVSAYSSSCSSSSCLLWPFVWLIVHDQHSIKQPRLRLRMRLSSSATTMTARVFRLVPAPAAPAAAPAPPRLNCLPVLQLASRRLLFLFPFPVSPFRFSLSSSSSSAA